MRPPRISLLLAAVLLAACAADELDPAAGIGEDVGDNTVVDGARDFVSCNQGVECQYLWSEAYAWLAENADFDVGEEDARTLVSFSPEAEGGAQIQYRVHLEPAAGGVATIRVETFCTDADACRGETFEQAYRLNEYLRNHKRALAGGVVEMAEDAIPELPRRGGDAADDDPRLAGMELAPADYPQGNHEARAREALEEAGCLERSTLTLLRAAEAGDELYEAECLTEVRAMVLRCGRAGCDTLR